MQVAKNKVISIDYTLTDAQGTELDTSHGRGPFAYIHGIGNIIPGLEAALEGKSMGDQVNAVIPPEKAYGTRDENLVQQLPRSRFDTDQDIQVGMQFQAMDEAGPRVVTVVSVDVDNVIIDANHPLAGVTLHFDVTVKEIREATGEELNHGHVHGPDDQHH
jgi:FKBP-type peptidyl-prolyl cis-trans isomerase SlyD